MQISSLVTTISNHVALVVQVSSLVTTISNHVGSCCAGKLHGHDSYNRIGFRHERKLLSYQKMIIPLNITIINKASCKRIECLLT